MDQEETSESKENEENKASSGDSSREGQIIKERVADDAQKESDRKWSIRDHLGEPRVLGYRVRGKMIGDKKGGSIDAFFTDKS